MNKIPLVIHSGDNLLKYPGVTEIRTSLARSSKDIKMNDFKSPSKLASNSSSAKNLHFSPSEHFTKIGYALKNTKSPIRRPNHAIFSIDDFEYKENCSFEAKAASISRLDVKKNITSLNTNRSTAATTTAPGIKSSASSQIQTHRNKSPTYDINDVFSSRKTNKAETQALGSLIISQKDVKTSFSVETPQKTTLPVSLKLTLDKICKKEGSSTHRTVMHSPSAEKIGKSFIQQQQKNSRDLGSESKTRQSQTEKNLKNSNAKQKLNTMLVGLTKPSVSQGKGSSRHSTRNVNSVTGTPRQNHSGVYSIDEENEMAKKYNKLLEVLKEKNKEIKKLAHDKSELQSSLYMIEGELQTLKKEKGVSNKVKEDSVSEVHEGTQLEDSRVQSSRYVDKSQIHSPNVLHSTYLCQKSIIDLSNGDIKTSKQPATNLLGVFGKNGHVISDRSGKSWMASIDTRMLKGRKRSNNADRSLEYSVGKNSSYISLERNRQENSFRQRNENCSHKEKLSYLKEIDEEFEDQHNKKKQNEVFLASLSGSTRLQGDNQRKKTRKGKAEKNERENTSVDDVALFRNPSLETALRSQSQLHGKQIGLNNSMAHLTAGNTSQDLNIGEALTELKDRIKKLLVKRNDEDNTKAHQLYENIYERLQKVV